MIDSGTITADYTLHPSEPAATLTLSQPRGVWRPQGTATSMSAEQAFHRTPQDRYRFRPIAPQPSSAS